MTTKATRHLFPCMPGVHADEVKCIRKWKMYVYISQKHLNKPSVSNANISQIKMPPKKPVFEPCTSRRIHVDAKKPLQTGTSVCQLPLNDIDVGDITALEMTKSGQDMYI